MAGIAFKNLMRMRKRLRVKREKGRKYKLTDTNGNKESGIAGEEEL